ncbi:MAG: peptidoglycan-binding protein [Patescibacteria group bacterium]|nr:peptidoglycan-binding protein [Patescibacteria group bacterium]
MTKRLLAVLIIFIALLTGVVFSVIKLISWISSTPNPEATETFTVTKGNPLPIPQFASTSTFPLGPVTYDIARDTTHSFAIPSIKAAQQLLKRDDYLPLPTVGKFDETMEKAVEEYQHAHDLAVTGAVGSLTRRMMNAEIQAGRMLTPDPNLRMMRNITSSSTSDYYRTRHPPH